MILFRRLLVSLSVLGVLPGLSVAAEDAARVPAAAPAQDPAGADAAQAALEKKFAEDMSGVVFAGSYSVTRDGKSLLIHQSATNRILKVTPKEPAVR